MTPGAVSDARADEPAPAGGVSRAHKVAAAAFIALILVPHVSALVRPYEDWPFTTAPMFAHYVDDATPRYRFRFAGDFGAHGIREIGSRHLATTEWSLMRFFFGKVYGSSDPRSPFGRHPQDGRARLEERLGRFFTGLVKRLRQTSARDARRLRGIRLEVCRLDAADGGACRAVGRFDVAARRYTHTWR